MPLQHNTIYEHKESRRNERRRLLLAMVFTGVILLVEFVGGILTNSLALLADAGHMLVDFASLLLSFLAMLFATLPPDRRRTYGYHRTEILAALANGVTLVLICLYIFYEAYRRLANPPEINSIGMLVIASIGLIANIAALVSLHGGESLNIRSAILHVLGDTLSSVGIIAGGIVILLTGWRLVDPLISIGIAFLILLSAYRVTREALDILLESTPSDIDLEEVVRAIKAIDGVNGVHDVHIWTITSGLYALSAHLGIAQTHDSQHSQVVHQVETVLRNSFGIHHTTIQCECQHCEDTLLCTFTNN
jgi:cobalt-zinc-cadmium efflux system protein